MVRFGSSIRICSRSTRSLPVRARRDPRGRLPRGCGSEHEDTFAGRYARERLAVLDGDTEKIVTLLGGDRTRAFSHIGLITAAWEIDNARGWVS